MPDVAFYIISKGGKSGRQENQKFKVILNYLQSLRPYWAS